MYIYIYIYDFSLSLYIYIYIFICNTYAYIYIYMVKDIVNKSELKAKAESDHVTAKDRRPPDLSAEIT